MKRIALLVFAVFSIAVNVPVYAAEMSEAQKDECLLASKSCMNEVDSIQQKMTKLNAEIEKGTKVYTAEEIKQLKAKLAEAEEILDNLNKR